MLSTDALRLLMVGHAPVARVRGAGELLALGLFVDRYEPGDLYDGTDVPGGGVLVDMRHTGCARSERGDALLAELLDGGRR